MMRYPILISIIAISLMACSTDKVDPSKLIEKKFYILEKAIWNGNFTETKLTKGAAQVEAIVASGYFNNDYFIQDYITVEISKPKQKIENLSGTASAKVT